ncbi:MAG TPA: phosphoadenosine phosphosulfate reductase family protein [Longimicrobiales bacterium]
MRLLSDLTVTQVGAGVATTRRLAGLARTTAHRHRIADAEQAIHDILTTAGRCYVAVSGGKDAAALLALAAPLARTLGVPLVAAWSDDELEYPEQREYVPRLCESLGVDLWIWCGHARHGGWFRSWHEPPYWTEPHPLARNAPGPDHVGGQRSMAALGYDGVLLGLRAQESRQRAIHARWRGRVYPIAGGRWRAQPLAWWTVEDVWALLLDRAVPVNPVYARLASIGVPLEEQRVGPLPLCRREDLRRGWPVLYPRLVARYGERW